MTKAQIIVFVGTVGAGKSTHKKILKYVLNSKGLKAKSTTLKTGHFFTHLLTILLANILAGHRKDIFPIRALLEEKSYVFRRIFNLWQILDIVGITIKFLLSIYIPFKLGYIILVEEHVPATISDYIYISKTIKYKLNLKAIRFRYLLRLTRILIPIHIIFLDASNVHLKSRWEKRKSIDEKEDYLNMQRTVLLNISKIFDENMLYINTENKNIIQTYNELNTKLYCNIFFIEN